MNIARGYKRFMAFGCSHGALVHWGAVRKVAKFRETFKPHRVFHLGDVIDFAAFRSGAHGTKDEADLIAPDIASGVRALEMLQPTDVMIGNHDVRVWRLASHQNAIIAHAASCARQEFVSACNKLKIGTLTDHYDVNKSWIQLGDTKLLHGFFFNENAMRDHAEHFGKSIIAHLHVAGMGNGRRSDHPVCYCVGTLADIGAMDYASTRRSTSRWSHGFVWGYYNDRECIINLSQCPQGEVNNWILP